MICRKLGAALTGLLLLALAAGPVQAKCAEVYGQGKAMITVASGSPGELGLLKAWAQAYARKHDVSICWRKAGSGAALRMLKARQVDLALVHAPAAEKEALAQGWAQARLPLGGNQFFIVGPAEDPARVAEASSATDAYARIMAAKAKFVSRGDGSGTHKREMAIWHEAGLKPGGTWYLPAHDFMLATLLLADRQGAYFMTGSSTWHLARARHGLAGMAVLFKDDPKLVNHYHALLPPTGATPGADLAREFARFISSPAGQAIMADYGKKQFGHALYQPVAAPAQPKK